MVFLELEKVIACGQAPLLEEVKEMRKQVSGMVKTMNRMESNMVNMEKQNREIQGMVDQVHIFIVSFFSLLIFLIS